MKKYQRLCLMSILISAGAFVGGCALEDACDTVHQYRLTDDEHAAITADPELFKLYEKDSKGKLNWCQEFDAKHCSTEVRNGISVYKNCFEALPNIDARQGVECINMYGDEKGRYDFQCSAKLCSPLYHLERDPNDDTGKLSVCAIDTDEHCGDLGNCNDIEGVAENSGYCNYVGGEAVCNARACAKGFWLNADAQCVPQTAQNCGSDGANNCIETFGNVANGTAECKNEECRFICNDGYEAAHNTTACLELCDQNQGYYRNPENDECELRCASNQQQIEGRCVNQCDAGYHLDTECLKQASLPNNCCIPNNTVEHCGIDDRNCLDDGAELAICFDPLNDHIPEPEIPKGECIDPKQLEAQREALLLSFRSDSSNYKDLKCNAFRCDSEHNRSFVAVGAGDQIGKKDDSLGYYYCEPATVQRCGRDRINCKDDELYWSEGNCFVDNTGYGICLANACEAGGYLDLIKCKPYNANHCGVDNIKCPDAQLCDESTGKCVNRCADNQRSFNRICYDPNTSIQYCGTQKESCIADHNNKHEALKKCENGRCKLVRCLYGYHMYDDPVTGQVICEEDTSDHCGVNRVICKSSSFGNSLPMICDKETQTCVVASSVYDLAIGGAEGQCIMIDKDPVEPSP